MSAREDVHSLLTQRGTLIGAPLVAMRDESNPRLSFSLRHRFALLPVGLFSVTYDVALVRRASAVNEVEIGQAKGRGSIKERLR